MQKEKKLHDFPYMWNLKKVKYMEAESRMAATRSGQVKGNGDMLVKGYIIEFMQDQSYVIYVGQRANIQYDDHS